METITRMTTPMMKRLLWAGLALCLGQSPAALATGLGPVRGTAVIGEPLALEVEVIDPNRVALECFEYSASPAGSDDRYFQRRTVLDLKKTDAGKTILLIRGSEVREPIVEFRITALCGAHLTRDYTLLAMPGRELRYELPTAAPAARLATEKPAEVEKAAAAPAPAKSALPTTGPTLEQLARQRYPLQPKARAKFKRMVREANPEQLGSLGDDEAIPVRPEALQYPDNLPKRRYGPYIPPAKKKPAPPPEAPPATEKPATPSEPPPVAPAPQARPEETPKDKLVIGTGGTAETPPLTPAEAAVAEKAEASFANQEDMVAKLAQAENAYKELKDQLLAIENRMAALEQEKERLKREAEKKADGAVTEFIVAVLIGGLLGALLMIGLRRRKGADMPIEIGGKL